MKTKNTFGNFKNSIAIIIAIFMMALNISAENTSKDCQPGKTINSSKKFVECENGNAFTALAEIIEQIENTIKFKGSSITDDEESKLALTQNKGINVAPKFISFESKSFNTSGSNEVKINDVIKNKQELTTWLQKNLDYELKGNFDTKYGELVVYLEVSKNGTLDNCSIVKTSDPEVDKIVIKLLSGAPLKMLLSENGYAVKQRFEIPVRYDIKL
jgi:hypothetical protein